jgi:hypothetical protein
LGFWTPAPLPTGPAPWPHFDKDLAEADFVENRNVAFEFLWADGQFDRLPGLAADLVGRKVAIIAAFGNAAARAAKAATTTIPVAFAGSSDPVAVGLVTSLTRPGANVTGVSILNQELESTRLERLVQVVPHATTIAFLVNPKSLTADPKLREMENAARMFNRQRQTGGAKMCQGAMGPVDRPPWKRHRRLPGSTFTLQGFPCRFCAPQTGRCFGGSGDRSPAKPRARSSRQSAPIRHSWSEQACRAFEAGQQTNPWRCQVRQASRAIPLPGGGAVRDPLLNLCRDASASTKSR